MRYIFNQDEGAVAAPEVTPGTEVAPETPAEVLAPAPTTDEGDDEEDEG